MLRFRFRTDVDPDEVALVALAGSGCQLTDNIHSERMKRGRTLSLEPPGLETDGEAADPTDLISPTLGCALVRVPVGLIVSVPVKFQFAFLNAAKVNHLRSFSSIPSDLREVSVSLANATGV